MPTGPARLGALGSGKPQPFQAKSKKTCGYSVNYWDLRVAVWETRGKVWGLAAGKYPHARGAISPVFHTKNLEPLLAIGIAASRLSTGAPVSITVIAVLIGLCDQVTVDNSSYSWGLCTKHFFAMGGGLVRSVSPRSSPVTLARG